MSHITTVAVDVTNMGLLEAALKKLGFTYKKAKSGMKTTGSYAQTHVDLRLKSDKKGNNVSSIGFRKEGKKYVMSGDFYYTGYSAKGLGKQVQRMYTTIALIRKLKAAGATITKNPQLKVDKKGNIQFVASIPRQN